MNNIHLTILGSTPFSSILNELEFNNILNLNNYLNYSNKKILVKILFAESLKIKDVKNYLLENEPIILFFNHKDYIKKNNLKLLDFHVNLELPIEILSFKEILNILITKYNFFKKSKIIFRIRRCYVNYYYCCCCVTVFILLYASLTGLTCLACISMKDLSCSYQRNA